MDGGAMKIALVFAGNFDHENMPFWPFYGAKQRHKHRKSRKGEKIQHRWKPLAQAVLRNVPLRI